MCCKKKFIEMWEEIQWKVKLWLFLLTYISSLRYICWKPVNQAELTEECESASEDSSLNLVYGVPALWWSTWGFIVLSSKRIYFCFVTYLFVQREPVKTRYDSLFSNRRVHCYEFGQFWKLIFSPQKLPLGFLVFVDTGGVGDICGLLGRNFYKKASCSIWQKVSLYIDSM